MLSEVEAKACLMEATFQLKKDVVEYVHERLLRCTSVDQQQVLQPKFEDELESAVAQVVHDSFMLREFLEDKRCLPPSQGRGGWEMPPYACRYRLQALTRRCFPFRCPPVVGARTKMPKNTDRAVSFRNHVDARGSKWVAAQDLTEVGLPQVQISCNVPNAAHFLRAWGLEFYKEHNGSHLWRFPGDTPPWRTRC